MQKLKELIKVSNLRNFQLFASDIEGNISHQKLLNCWVAKKLMSHTFSVKFRVFRREFRFSETIRCIGVKVSEKTANCYALSKLFRVFTLLASSDSDKHMLMRQKVPIAVFITEMVILFNICLSLSDDANKVKTLNIERR